MDDYDLLPHDEIKKLKTEIDSLKRTATSEGSDRLDSVAESMDNMTRSMNSLLKIFKEAGEEMKLDEHDSVLLSDKIDPLLQKIDRVLEQNEKIAKGIVAIADMIEDLKSSMHPEPKPVYTAKRITTYTAPPLPPEPVQEPEPRMPQQPEFPQAPSFSALESQVSQQARPFPAPPTMPQENDKKQQPLFNIKFK